MENTACRIGDDAYICTPKLLDTANGNDFLEQVIPVVALGGRGLGELLSSETIKHLIASYDLPKDSRC